MRFRYLGLFAAALTTITATPPALAAQQPIAIFHAHNQYYREVKRIVCTLGKQGYSHVQIAPAQKSNPSQEWWARYQPVDYRVVEGRGSEAELKDLIQTAHRCGVKVIADVVFNHMANMPQYQTLQFPTFGPEDFQPRCETNYDNPTYKWTLHRCWLGDLPDLDVTRKAVQAVQTSHLKKLLSLGIDGFRFDAAKHMPPAVLETYVQVARTRDTWNYLEVIEGGSTRAEEYNVIAPITDFRLYQSLRNAFSFGGDLRSLRVPQALNDPRSVTFARNHDTVREINSNAVAPYDNPADAHLATAYILAREQGTPLILNIDSQSVPYVRHGVMFRKIMQARGKEGKAIKENILAVINSSTLLLMERGSEGFFVVNKAAEHFNIPTLDLTLTNLDGCYRELQTNIKVAIERRPNGKKYITRWGTWQRGGMEVKGRDALYFIREPWSQCQK